MDDFELPLLQETPNWFYVPDVPTPDEVTRGRSKRRAKTGPPNIEISVGPGSEPIDHHKTSVLRNMAMTNPPFRSDSLPACHA